MAKQKHTNEELIKIMRNFYDTTKLLPSQKMFSNKNDLPSYSVYVKRFGSFQNAIKECGIQIPDNLEYRFQNNDYTDEELLDVLKKKTEEHLINNKYLLSEQQIDDDKTMPSSATYQRRFGGVKKSFSLIGYNFDEFNRNVYRDEMINSLKKLAKEIGRTPNSREIDYYSKLNKVYATKTYMDHFGSLINAYTVAELMYEDNAYYTTLGTKCLSLYEYNITQWFEDNNFKYNKEIYYRDIIPNDNTLRRFDWVITISSNTYYIEMFGIEGNVTYDLNTKQKILDCKRNNINLISLFPKDLKRPLNEVFSFLLNKYENHKGAVRKIG